MQMQPLERQQLIEARFDLSHPAGGNEVYKHIFNL
jgi:hypothetical protein